MDDKVLVVDDRDALIASLRAQLTEKTADVDTLRGMSVVDFAKVKQMDTAGVEMGAHLSDAQAADAALVAEAAAAVELENERRQAEYDATQAQIERSRAVGGAFTPQGVHYGSGCI